MNLKMLILMVAMAVPAKEYAQTAINKAIPVEPGGKLSMHFDYPRIVKLTTWEGSEVVIQGNVSINGGENDDAFVLQDSRDGDLIRISSEVRGIKNLPRRITMVRDGQKIMFKDKAALEKYQSENGRGYNNISWGPDIEIHLDIKVPRDIETSVTSVYGMVEVENFTGPLSVDATYGGVDASLAEKAVGEITAETNFGNIYTNFDIKFDGNEASDKDFYTFVSAKPGRGPRYSFESKYGNVYLRKAN